MKVLCLILCGLLLLVTDGNAFKYECYHYEDGLDYNGTVSTTWHGVECQAWSAQEPHEHTLTPEDFSDYGIGDHNYCRNPDGEPNGPWCYTTDPDTRWGYCYVGPRSKQPCDEDPPEENADYWLERGIEEVQEALSDNDRPNNGFAKNVILMVGDGLDTTTTTAARILKEGVCGELNYETLPWHGMLKTFNCDSQVPDSGSAATALFSGVKTKSDVLGVDCSVEYEDCSTVEDATVYSILHDFMYAGKSTGIVTTAHITDATPAALYAHTANRMWENDVDLEDDECMDIAAQLVANAANVTVILGGGREDLLPEDTEDPEYPDVTGVRADGRNLIDEWLEGKDNAEYVYDLTGIRDVDTAETDYLIGLFEPGDMHYEVDRGMDGNREPPISTMTATALEILQKNDEGYFLMVEAGQIDDAHHEGHAQKALYDTLAFDAAVKHVMETVDLRDTLVIVTSDHAQALGMSGYAARNNSILAVNDEEDTEDGLPFTTLQYITGPGGVENLGGRRDLTDENTADPDFVQSASVPLESSNHAGQDVPVYAAGPLAHLFHRTHDQTFVANVVRMAACLGEYEDMCSRSPREKKYRKQKLD